MPIPPSFLCVPGPLLSKKFEKQSPAKFMKPCTSKKQLPNKRCPPKEDMNELRTLKQRALEMRANLKLVKKGLKTVQKGHIMTKEKLEAAKLEVLDAELKLSDAKAAHDAEIAELKNKVASQRKKALDACRILNEEKAERVKRSKADYIDARKKAEERLEEEVRKLKKEAISLRRQAEDE